MRFVVPKFIEYEPKIIGPLTFNQFIYIGSAAGACLFIYFFAPFHVFITSCLVLGGTAFALAFLKVAGKSLPAVLANFLKFNLSPKNYLWKKKKTARKMFQEEKIVKQEKTEESSMRIIRKSQLNNLRDQVETKIR